MPYKDPVKRREYHNAYSLEWRERNPEKVRSYARKSMAKFVSNNREIVNERNRAWREANPEKSAAAIEAWHQRNPNSRREARRKYKKGNGKLSESIRARVHHALRGYKNCGSPIRSLGCSIEFLRDYIESKFSDGMNWDNWGTIWELDHIKHLASFDLTDRAQFLVACHYTNLQPLSVAAHKRKSANERWPIK